MQTWNVKTIAEAYRRALAVGVADPAETVQWLDREIASEAHPISELLDASLALSAGVPALIGALGALPGECNTALAVRGFFYLARRGLAENKQRGPAIAQALFRMAVNKEAPSSSAESGMYYFHDAFDLATQGIHGSEEEVRSELMNFLGEHSAWPEA